jgi:DNA-binding transcriptional LysR family regulator
MMDYQFASAGPALRIISLLFLFLFVLAAVAAVVGIASLPGWIARKRNHPQAAAINICGWFGLPTGVLWVLAMVWAYFKPSVGSDANFETDPDVHRRLDRLEATLSKLESPVK